MVNTDVEFGLLGVPSCTPIRRHSWSAPPGLLLDSCLEKVALLSEKVDRVTEKLRSSSASDLHREREGNKVVRSILDQLLSTIDQGECIMVKSRQCHHCHRPIDHPSHAGIGSGVNRCTLDHYELCPGGRKSGQDWTGCPATTTDGDSETEELNKKSASGLDKDQASSRSQSSLDTLGRRTPNNDSEIDGEFKNSELKNDTLERTVLDPRIIADSLNTAAAAAHQVILHESTDDEEERILQAEVAKLRIQVEQDEARQKSERKREKLLNRQRLEKEKAELLRKAKAQKKLTTPPLPPVDRSLAQNNLSVSPQPSMTTANDHLHRQAGNLAARQQQQAADRRRTNQAGQIDRLTIGGIRSLPGMTPEVEQLLTGLQSIVPTLAKAPTAPSASGQSFQPAGVLAGQQQVGDGGGEEYDTEYVYNPGRGKYVQVVRSPTRDSAGQSQASLRPIVRENQAKSVHLVHADSGDETSADEDCPVEASPGYRLVWRRDELGEKYFVQKLAKKFSSPEMVSTYATGRWYKRTVPKTDLEKTRSVPTMSKRVKQSNSNQTPVYVDHRMNDISPVPQMTRGVRTPTASAPLPLGERVPGIVPIDPEKQGKDGNKIPDRVQWARNCPVNWTSKVTSANINVVLWAWAYMSELLATRTGMSSNLEKGELEARMQHFCHVLEIALQTSGQNDFCGDSWNVARLYDKKVQQKVDSRMFTWVKLAAMNHGASMPHELIAATQELARKPKDPKNSDDKNKGKFGGKDGNGKPKSTLRCYSWNSSETRGKCNWEIENAPEKCNRVHECTWCKSKKLTPVNHQRSFCGRRLEEEQG